jgi:hypothetical protein
MVAWNREIKFSVYKFLIAVVAILLFAYIAYLTLDSPYPDGHDVWFHIMVARAWYKGENGMVCPAAIYYNGMPYPPLFHLMLAPFCSSLSSALDAAKAFQLFFYPLAILFFMLLVKKYSGSKTALIAGIALSGTYLQFTQSQAIPQSLETLFFFPAVYGLLENKKWVFIGSVAAMFYTHSPISVAFCLGAFTYIFMKDKKDVKLWGSIAAAAPIVAYQLSYVVGNGGFLSRWVVNGGDTGMSKETAQFLANPAFWTLNGLGLNVIAFAIAFWLLYKWSSQTEFTKVMLLTFFGSYIIFPVWYERVFSISVIPMAFFTGQFILKQKNKYVKMILLVALGVQFAWFFSNPVWLMNPDKNINIYW